MNEDLAEQFAELFDAKLNEVTAAQDRVCDAIDQRFAALDDRLRALESGAMLPAADDEDPNGNLEGEVEARRFTGRRFRFPAASAVVVTPLTEEEQIEDDDRLID